MGHGGGAVVGLKPEIRGSNLKAQPEGEQVFDSIRIHLSYLTAFSIKAVFNDHMCCG